MSSPAEGDGAAAAAPPAAQHKPYVSPEADLRELTLRGVVLGSVLGIVFAASSVYLALKVGLTVSASIPIAVLSITIFRFFGGLTERVFGPGAKAAPAGLRWLVGKATILENNVVQTAGSAGESIAAGVAFTLPSLLLMGYELESAKVLVISLLGGLLGVLMMIPLRHGLIVEEHGKLTYPEGTACADVLIVGETGGTNAKTVLSGFGLGFLYKLAGDLFKLFNMNPESRIPGWKGASIGGELSPEMLGVGYIIGPRTAAQMMAGGVLAYLILIPLVAFFGDGLAEPVFPATKLIRDMDPHAIRTNYVLYIGAGAVATGGFVSLGRALPTIVKAFKAGIKNFSTGRKPAEAGGASRSGAEAVSGASRSAAEAVSAAGVPRTMQDLPFSIVIYGSIGLVAIMWLAPMLEIKFVPAILILLFGFFFVVVSSRITGEIGSSSNPISGMTVATLLLTCVLFLAMGWVGVEYRAMALTTAAIVCIAASNGGTTSQDLKTGFLVGATPRRQQISLLVGVVTSALVIGLTLVFFNEAYTTVAAESYADALPAAGITQRHVAGPDGKDYRVGFMSESGKAVPQGKYLVEEGGKIAFVVDPGIAGRVPWAAEKVEGDKPAPAGAEKKGSQLGPDRRTYDVIEVAPGAGLTPGRYLADGDRGTVAYHLKEVKKFDAPKASLFALIIDGILTRKLPWSLVLIGVMIALVMELCGVASLPFAVGVYLPISTSVPIFAGGMLRWLVDRLRKSKGDEEFSAGTLLASGYIAGGAIAGLVSAVVIMRSLEDTLDLGAKLGAVSPVLGALCQDNVNGVRAFALLALALYLTAGRGEAAVQAPAPQNGEGS